MTANIEDNRADVFTNLHLVKAMELFSESLSAESALINALNVFPVPDGDTGSNMAATAKEAFLAATAFLKENSITDIGDSGINKVNTADLCKRIARGSLMGARGNSGVILCQIIRAFVDTCAEQDTIDASVLIRAVQNSSEAAWQAVQKPVKGTMLSVAAGAASGVEKLLNALSATTYPEDVLEAAYAGSKEALAATPEQLDVLKKAGIVDSGGAGLTLFYASLAAAYSEEATLRLWLPDATLAKIAGDIGENSVDEEDFAGDRTSPELAELSFEVMYLLEAPDESIKGFRQALDFIGDSIVVVGGDGLYNCHVHTDDAGAAVEAALDIGRPRQIRITYLLGESSGALENPQGEGGVKEEVWVTQALVNHQVDASLPTGSIVDAPGQPDAKTVVVAVSIGEGVNRLLLSLGVAKIIPGFQSMNPSTKDILDAISSFEDQDVIVLPNNPNIVSVAEQAVGLLERENAKTYVLPTVCVQEALSALVDFDPMAAGEENLEQMESARQRVKSGEVTSAVRDSTFGDVVIEKGDYIGIAKPKGIVVATKTLAETLIGLVEYLIDDKSELVTILEGTSYDESSSRSLKDWLEEKHPNIALERLRGGQPVYHYLLSVE
jgi:hypothetical protein